MSAGTDTIMASAAAIGAVATIAYTVISLRLWRSTQQQVQLTRDQLELTVKQLELTKASFDAANQKLIGVGVSISVPEDRSFADCRILITYEVTNRGTCQFSPYRPQSRARK